MGSSYIDIELAERSLEWLTKSLLIRGKNHAFLSAARNEHADLQVHFVLPFFLPSVKRLKEAFRGQKSTGTWVIEATDFRIEVRSDL